MDSVLIYRDQLLPGSETFIRAQAEHLPTYQPYYTGMKHIPDGLSLPGDRSVIVNRQGWLGRVKEAFAQFVRFPPSLLKTVKSWDPSLIHAHFGPDAVNALRLARHLDVPLAVTFHGYGLTIHDEYARESFYRHRNYLRNRERVKENVDCVIAVSDFVKQKLIESGFPNDRIVQHYIGIDLKAFQPRTDVEREDIILFVGRFVEKKGGDHLIRAGARVQEAHPDVRVVFVGDGRLRSEWEALADEVGCNAQFVGFQPPEQVRNWLSRARVFCVPSVVAESGDTEAFGMVFAEAQAMGVPVVSFESGGIPEVVKHGETGLLAPEGDWHELARHLRRLLADPDMQQSFSQAGSERVHRKFDVGKQSKDLETIYDDIVNNF